MAKHRFHASHLQYFWHELSMLQQQGKTLAESLDYLCFDPVIQRQDPLMVSIRDHYQQKHSLADALSLYGQYIDAESLQLLRLGEAQGRMQHALEHLAHRRTNRALMHVLVKVLTYPVAIFCACLTLSIFLMIFVVTMFAEIYGGMGRHLPAPTLIFLTASSWLMDFWWLMMFAFVGVIVLLKQNQYLRFYLMLRIPMLKRCLQLVAISELLGTFAVMLQTEAKAKETLAMVAGTLSNPVYRLAWQQTFKQEHDLLGSLRQIGCLPDSFTRMIAVGQETKQLHDVCERLAQQAAESAHDALESFAVWSRMFLMFCMGALVGSIVIAMYFPIFQMASSL